MASKLQLVAVDEREPWDRRQDETTEAFYGFTAYRSAGPKRKKATIAKEIGVHANTIGNWAATYDWDTRCQAWDYYQDRIFQAEIAESQREVARKQADFADKALQALNAPIQAILDRLETDPEAVMAEFGAKDIMKLMKTAQDSAKIYSSLFGAELRALGQPTEITERHETHNVNYNDAQRIGEVLDVLKGAGVLDAFLADGGAGEIIDAEVVEVDDDRPDTQTDSIPASTE